MARFKEKIKAVSLRKKGESIGEIAQKLNVSKSIVSLWCRDISLSRKQIGALQKKMLSGSYKGRMIFLERVRRKRKKETAELLLGGIKEIGNLTKRDILIAGTALYWAEGTKSVNKEQNSISNSSSEMILFIIRWFKDIFGVSKDRFIIQVRINKIHKNRIKEIEGYWSKITKIPLNQFTKTILIKSVAKKVYSDDNYYGTIRLSVRGGTRILRNIMGLIKGLEKNNMPG